MYAPKSALVFNNRACAWLEQCEYARAMQDCNSALEIDPVMASAYCNRGSAYMGMHDLRRATDDYERCLSLDQNYVVAHTNKAFVALVEGNYARASEHCNHAMQLDSAYSLAARNRGIIAFCLRQFEEAQNYLVRAAELDPKAAELVVWLILTSRRRGTERDGEFTAQLAALNLGKWPGPLLSFLSGTSDEPTVLSAASDPNPDRELGQLCAAYFVLGEAALINGDPERGQMYLRKCHDTGAINFLEYCAAKSELDHLGVSREMSGPEAKSNE